MPNVEVDVFDELGSGLMLSYWFCLSVCVCVCEVYVCVCVCDPVHLCHVLLFACKACKAWCAHPAWVRYHAIKIHLLLLLLLLTIFVLALFRSHPELDLRHYGVTAADNSSVPLSGIFYGGGDAMPVSELIDQLERTYCGAVAAEFEHLTVSGHICGALSRFGMIDLI